MIKHKAVSGTYNKSIHIWRLGIWKITFTKIYRHNINHYFLVKVVGNGKIHHVSAGDELIDSILSLKIEDILNEYRAS